MLELNNDEIKTQEQTVQYLKLYVEMRNIIKTIKKIELEIVNINSEISLNPKLKKENEDKIHELNSELDFYVKDLRKIKFKIGRIEANTTNMWLPAYKFYKKDIKKRNEIGETLYYNTPTKRDICVALMGEIIELQNRVLELETNNKKNKREKKDLHTMRGRFVFVEDENLPDSISIELIEPKSATQIIKDSSDLTDV